MEAVTDFLSACQDSFPIDAFDAFLFNTAKSFKSVSNDQVKQQVIAFFRTNDRTVKTLTTVAEAVESCKNQCDKIIVTYDSMITTPVAFNSFIEKIELIIATLDAINAQSQEVQVKLEEDNKSLENSQQYLYDAYEDKLRELKEELNDLEKKNNELVSLVDSKVFQLLITTIAVLAIFVAVAYAGFSGTSLLASIEFNFSGNMLRGLLAFFLVFLFVYNILLALGYFMVFILNKFHASENALKKVEFLEFPNFAFFAIDTAIFLICVALFIFIQCGF